MVIEGTYLNIIKAMHNKPIANITLCGEKLKGFPLRSGIRQVVYVSFKTALKFLQIRVVNLIGVTQNLLMNVKITMS